MQIKTSDKLNKLGRLEVSLTEWSLWYNRGQKLSSMSEESMLMGPTLRSIQVLKQEAEDIGLLGKEVCRVCEREQQTLDREERAAWRDTQKRKVEIRIAELQAEDKKRADEIRMAEIEAENKKKADELQAEKEKRAQVKKSDKIHPIKVKEAMSSVDKTTIEDLQ